MVYVGEQRFCLVLAPLILQLRRFYQLRTSMNNVPA